MTCHLNSTLFCTSTTKIANHKPSYSYGSSIYCPPSQAFHSKLKCHFFKNFYPDSLDPPFSNFHHKNGICLNRYSVSSDLLEIRPELILDYPLDNPSDSLQYLSWCPALSS